MGQGGGPPTRRGRPSGVGRVPAHHPIRPAHRRSLRPHRRALRRAPPRPAPAPEPSTSPLLEHLDKVIANDELERRPRHAPDPEAHAEIQGLLEAAPGLALERACEHVLSLCGAGSAGVSLHEDRPEGGVFFWRAAVGALAEMRGAALPDYASPCSIVVERKQTLLKEWPAWVFPAVAALRPPAVEVLLTPVYEDDRPVGTLWALHHGEGPRPFDTEDRRVLEDLARLIAPALRRGD